MKNIALVTFTFLFLIIVELFAQDNFKTIAYLSVRHWSTIPQLNFEKVSHVNLSFGNSNATGYLEFSQDIKEVVVPAHKKNAKVFMAIGGGSITPAVTAIYTEGFKPENRDSFVHHMVNYVQINQLDGIDVDIENDALLIPYFNEFAVSLATELHKNGKQISAAVSKWSGGRINKTTLDVFDWINLMSYDVTAPWRPLNPGQHSPMIKMTNDFAYWNNDRGIDKKKINLGVPFYGYEFVSTTKVNSLTFNEIVTLYPGSENTDVVNGNLFYNGIPTIIQKTDYAFQNAGGIMFWEWGQDGIGNKSLLNTIYTEVESLKSKHSKKK